MGNGRPGSRLKSSPPAVLEDTSERATGIRSPGASNRAVARTLGGAAGTDLRAALEEAARIDAVATRTITDLGGLTQPAHMAIARTNQVMLDYAARYRVAYESFERTLVQAGKDAAGPGAGSIIFGFASSILIAVGVGAAGALIVQATTRLGQAVLDAVSETVEMGAGAGVGLLVAPGKGAFAVPDDLDPRLKEIAAWKETAQAWQALAGLAQIGLNYSAVWRRAAEVHRDLHAFATGGQGVEDRAVTLAALAKLRTAVLDSIDPAVISGIAELIATFAARAEHPLLHRGEYFLEQDLWIEWISRLSGYDYAKEESDYWPVWMTDQVSESINEEAIEQRLAEIGLISIWRGTNYGGSRRLDMTYFHEGSEWSARDLLTAAIAARKQMRDWGAVGIAIESGNWISVELPPPAFETTHATATSIPGPYSPLPGEPMTSTSDWHPPLLPDQEPVDDVPRGRVLQASTDMSDVVVGQLVQIQGEHRSGVTLAEPVPGDGGLPEWAQVWVERLRALNGW